MPYHTLVFLTLPFFILSVSLCLLFSFLFLYFLHSSLFFRCFLSCYFSHLFLLIPYSCLFLYYAQLRLFYIAVVISFIVLPLNYFWLGVGVLPKPPIGLLVAHPSHNPMLVVPRSIPRQKNFVLFSCFPWHSYLHKGWVFFLTNSYGMHLVILAQLYLFWVVCYPSRIFLPKELGRESQNRHPHSPHR